MNNVDMIGAAAFILAAAYTAVSFPGTVRMTHSQKCPRAMILAHLWLALLMYGCLALFAYLCKASCLLVFVPLLGVLKYASVLIQCGLHSIRRPARSIK